MASVPDARHTAALHGEAGRFVRFIAAGGANTLLAIGVYQLALFAVGYTLAYGIAYGVGIAFGWYVYSKHVFRAPLSAARLAAFAGFYVASMIAGAWLNGRFVEWLAFPPRLAIFATVAAMLPVNYAGSRWCLRGFGPARPG